jgi:hypothetical protein
MMMSKMATVAIVSLLLGTLIVSRLEAANVWQTSEVAFASANEADGSDMQKQQKVESEHADDGKRTVPSGANPIHNKHPKHPPSPSSSPMRPMLPRSIGSPNPS